MRLAIPFKRFERLNEVADEFNVNFDPKDNDFDKLIDFIQEYKNKRVNVSYKNGVEVKTAKALSKIGDNVYFKLDAQDVASAGALADVGARFFFNEHVSAYNAVSLTSMLSRGVSDVYIADDLWYDLKRTCDTCHDSNVAVRVVANRIPLTTFNRGYDPRHVILRPNDMDAIEGYVDTIEFDCYRNSSRQYDFAKLDVLYRAWFEKKDWNGDLREINDDLSVCLPNTTLVPQFTTCKFTCGMKCALGGTCSKCEQFSDISLDLTRKSVRFRKK